jgi:hypothetical protein
VPLHLARALDYRRRGEEAVPVPMGLPVA